MGENMETRIRFFSIWIGGEIPEVVKHCFEKNKDLPGFFIISDRKIPGFKTRSYKKIKEEIDKSLYAEIWKKSFERIYESKGYTILTAIADFVRFYICATRKNICYIDADAVYYKEQDLVPGIPSFAEHGNRVDICVMYNGGNRSFFKNFLIQTSKYPRERGLFCGWLNKMVNPEWYGIITYDNFTHEGEL